ncbi:MAG TPA: hypothetical protein VE824_07350 [Gaiellales bacterium]|nr:hypothetical protein [Gaiellales bacterium]
MQRSNDTRVYFVQVRPAGSRRWQTQAIGGSEDEARRLAQRDWSLPIAKARGELRVIGDAELERHGGLVAVMEAIASFHAEALRACRWVPIADEVVSGRRRTH